MIPVLTAEDVRRQDAEAASYGLTVGQLMENAGWAVARAAREMLGGTYGKRVVAVCGKGNNGGDGLVAARLLREMGAHATVVLVWPETELNELARTNLARFRGPVRASEQLGQELARADLVIDAIFGVGLTRAPEGPAARAIAQLTSMATLNPGLRKTRRMGRLGELPLIVSVDVPSGVDSDTGRLFDVMLQEEGGGVVVPQAAVAADRTVTLSGYKPGLLFAPGKSLAGEIEIASIGVRSDQRGRWFAPDGSSVAGPLRSRASGSHKRDVGTVVVVAGSRSMPGAAALVCGAALHTGAGFVTLCAPQGVIDMVVGRFPEVASVPCAETGEGTLDIKAWEQIQEALSRAHAFVIGPGLSTNSSTTELVRLVLARSRVPAVVDADGLNAIAGSDAERREAPTVLTPHAGEFARLGGDPAERLESARALAERTQATVVLKGPGTVVVGPDPLIGLVVPTGGPALAQAGTGDVLAGMIGSSVAQAHAHLAPHIGERAAGSSVRASHIASTVWLHGRAADRLAERLWPHPANASALIEEIGPTMHEVMSS